MRECNLDLSPINKIEFWETVKSEFNKNHSSLCNSHTFRFAWIDYKVSIRLEAEFFLKKTENKNHLVGIVNLFVCTDPWCKCNIRIDFINHMINKLKNE